MAGPTHPLSVLVVEDDPDGAETTAQLITIFGYHTRFVRSVAAAVAVAAAEPPDVVLVDIGLPDGNGYELVAKLAGTLPRKPVFVVLTGYQDLEVRSRRAGIDYHFLKPVEPGQLEDLLKTCATHGRGNG